MAKEPIHRYTHLRLHNVAIPTMQNHKRARNELDDDVMYAGTYPAGSTPSNSEYASIHDVVQPDNRAHQFFAWQTKHLAEKCARLETENEALRRQVGRTPSQSEMDAENNISRLNADKAYWKRLAKSLQKALDKEAWQAAS